MMHVGESREKKKRGWNGDSGNDGRALAGPGERQPGPSEGMGDGRLEGKKRLDSSEKYEAKWDEVGRAA